jgi:dipeptidyl aminopeptidase/acylaminoacyl peptidase
MIYQNSLSTPLREKQETKMAERKITKQFGLWKSSITPLSLARGLGFSDLAWDQDGTLVWRESRSDFNVLVVQPPGVQAHRDLNSEYNVRAGVGYGGGDFTVGFGVVYFVEAGSGRIYRQPTLEGTAQPVTPAFGSAASPVISPDGEYLLFVHSYERQDSIGLVDVSGKSWPIKLISGDDFYMQPCWHPDGKSIAWISWNHPQMPWDGTTLNLGTMRATGNNLVLGDIVPIAGDENTSVFQPQFSPDGRYLAYVSDSDGWWQLYLYDLDRGEHTVLTGERAEHGLPAWVQGLRTFDFSPDGSSIYYLRNQGGSVDLCRLDIASKKGDRIPIEGGYSWFSQVTVSPDGEQVALIASGGSIPSRVIVHHLKLGTRVFRRSLPEDLPSQTYAQPQSITWKGMDGAEVYGLYYPPVSETCEGVGKPPLMVLVHGGPTSQRGSSFDGQAQYFTSRGWSVLQVNYRGSTGYGREYRDMLKGNWGIYDVQDSVSGAKHLVEAGYVDGGKVVIMGGSAGGFTVLKALEDYPGFFKAGICLYGVANQFTLVADTHKFEERYSDSLLGPLPESASLYRERSPIFFADKIRDPIAIFQGEDDKVVPRNQSDEIVAALCQNNVPHEYHVYPGEGHGFRKTETIEEFYTTLERFLRQAVIFA